MRRTERILLGDALEQLKTIENIPSNTWRVGGLADMAIKSERKINRMHQLFGLEPGHACGE